MIENTDSFVYELRGEEMTWTPSHIEYNRVVCFSEKGDELHFDAVHINHIRFCDEMLKRRKKKLLSAEN